ncbi:septum site-determining protein MinD [Oceanotoga sp. DSM 15011]|jgi:septum site-determining protein MinD|uniref:Septum site-determining protein MinD n=1 Tax=Oceanotoga teriensis TaxID=515440 RepID=A0AA45HIH3_9BACT|nr:MULTISPECIES: septum site-determining protein MinD [Oceanotoga]MDN5343102.1 septum site-determining protein MinD [Oceanotoga sp.]MDO7977556.1 septum site-determining protein MinD [Oceanotoga teriensis]PWJ91224.1 septum site-determining protein MinD [Oceanotoga teriensis]UYO99699.1 septum site-determining protein MinD [Oceanotoga sp. DSM 15011]
MEESSKVFVVTSGKGGVGKTTITANIGSSLASKGYNVCLIDADIGLKNLDLVLGLENRIVYTIMDVVNGNKNVLDVLVKHKYMKNLSLLASSQTANKNMVTPADMKEIIAILSKHFHYIIIDSPAGIEQGFSNAIIGAQHAIVVTTPDLTAISDADRVIGLLENHGYTEKNMSLIVNRLKPKMVKRNDMVSADDIKEALAIDILGIIPDSEDIIISTNEGKPLSLDENSKMAYVFDNITERISGNFIPVNEDIKKFSQNSEGFFGFFNKLWKRG